MVFCFIALGIFGILGIFSASHRALFFEALSCVSRTVSLRPCESNFDQKMRAKLAGKLLRVSPSLSRAAFKHFQVLSWLLIGLMVVSLAGIGVGVYNWWAFGNCNGPNSSEFCVLNEVWGSNCSAKSEYGVPSLSNVHFSGSEAASLTIIEFGCYSCPFTKLAEADVARILAEYDGRVRFAFKPIPLPNHPNSAEMALAAECAAEQGKFVEMRRLLFENQQVCGDEGLVAIDEVARNANLDLVVYRACMASQKFASVIAQNAAEAVSVGICGTPTFFVGSKVLVSPGYDALKAAVDEALVQS